MDFDALQGILAREVLGDKTEDVWSIANDQLPMLYNASVEIASVLGFPQGIATGTLTAASTSIAPPADMLAAQINQVIVGDYNLRQVGYAGVLSLRSRSGSSTPEVYNYDPRRGGNIEVAPAPAADSPYFVEYTQEIDISAYTGGSEPWGGLFPQFHWLVPIRAGINAWRSVQDFERAQFFLSEYGIGVNAFAAFLGVPSPIGDPDQQERFRLDSVARS